jgi:glycosyltransferase involved in cell wall biosynthesis
VDNGSTDATPAVLERWLETRSLPLRSVAERRPGKSRALSAGIASASGEVLAFTDDDVAVEATWLDEIRAAMADDDVALVGGPVTPRWAGPAPRWLRRAGLDSRQPDASEYGRLAAPLALLHYGSRSAVLGPRTLLGANLAIRRSVLNEVRGFAADLGKLRGTLLSGEDDDLCRRVQAAGFIARYEPRAVVRHWVPAERMRVRYFLEWFFWSGITNAMLDERNPDAPQPKSLFGVPAYLVRRSAASLMGGVLAAATGRSSLAMERAIDCAFAAGYVAHRWGLAAPASERVRPTGAMA